MTNKDIFLRDGVSVEELIEQMADKMVNKYGRPFYKKDAERFFEDEYQKIPPTLTEDEEAILRNIDIKNYDIIGKNSLGVTFITSTKDSDKFIWVANVFAKNLFQFIKERRRI